MTGLHILSASSSSYKSTFLLPVFILKNVWELKGSKVQVISDDIDILFLQLYKNGMTDYGLHQIVREMI